MEAATIDTATETEPQTDGTAAVENLTTSPTFAPHDHANDIHSIPNAGAVFVEPPHHHILPPNLEGERDDPIPSEKKSKEFWLVYFAVCVSSFLSALELVRHVLCHTFPRLIIVCHRRQSVLRFLLLLNLSMAKTTCG